MFGAAVLMLLDNWAHHSEKAAKNIHQTFSDVEWITIFSSSACLSWCMVSRWADCFTCLQTSSSRRPAAT
jgi:hypothetical protein